MSDTAQMVAWLRETLTAQKELGEALSQTRHGMLFFGAPTEQERAARDYEQYVITGADVIADCEAKLEILNDHAMMTTKWDTSMCVRCDIRPGESPWPCRTLRLLAFGLRHREGWQDRWRP